MQKLLTIVEAAEMLRLSKLTLYKYVSQRRLKHVKVGSRVMFRETDLDAWIVSRVIEPIRG